jgi:Tfp pilus assembly protein PilX
MKLIRPFRNNKGMALITVVLIFLILVIMLGGAMFAAVVNQRNALFANDHTKAYYVAESGINTRISQKI